MEERVAQEALEALQLEKRLSLLSHSVRTASGGRGLGRARAGAAVQGWGPCRPAPRLQALSTEFWPGHRSPSHSSARVLGEDRPLVSQLHPDRMFRGGIARSRGPCLAVTLGLLRQ